MHACLRTITHAHKSPPLDLRSPTLPCPAPPACGRASQRGDVTLLNRTAHGADVHPTDSKAILLFGGFGWTSAAASPPSAAAPAGAGASLPPYAFIGDLAVLHTDTLVVERVRGTRGPAPAPRGYHSFTTLGRRWGDRLCVWCGGLRALGGGVREGGVPGLLDHSGVPVVACIPLHVRMHGL